MNMTELLFRRLLLPIYHFKKITQIVRVKKKEEEEEKEKMENKPVIFLLK